MMDFRMPQAIYNKLYLRDSGIEPSPFNKQDCLAKPNELAPTLATGLQRSPPSQRQTQQRTWGPIEVRHNTFIPKNTLVIR